MNYDPRMDPNAKLVGRRIPHTDLSKLGRALGPMPTPPSTSAQDELNHSRFHVPMVTPVQHSDTNVWAWGVVCMACSMQNEKPMYECHLYTDVWDWPKSPVLVEMADAKEPMQGTELPEEIINEIEGEK